MANVTLRGRFSAGTKVELVDGAFPDPLVAAPIKSGTVSSKGEVTFDLQPGREYAIRDEGHTRAVKISAPPRQAQARSLVGMPDRSPHTAKPQTPKPEVPQKLPKVENVPQRKVEGGQASDTKYGESVPVKVERVKTWHRMDAHVSDPVGHAYWNEPTTSKQLEAHMVSESEMEEEEAEKRSKAAKKAARTRKRNEAKKASRAKAKAQKAASAAKETVKSAEKTVQAVAKESTQNKESR